MDEICNQNQSTYISEAQSAGDPQDKPGLDTLQSKESCLLNVKKIPLSQNFLGQSVLLTTIAIICFGVIAAISSLASVKETPNIAWYQLTSVKHVLFALASIVILIIVSRFDYRVLSKGRIPYFAFTLFLLAVALCLLVNIPYVTPVIGHAKGGKYRWLKYGQVQFQPSELLKIAMVFYLSCWLGKLKKTQVRKFKTFILAGFCILLSAFLVIQYDMSSAALIMLSGGIVMLLAGVRWQFIILAGVLAGLAVGFYIYNDPMRKKRVEAMLNPFDNSNKSSYQIRQALISIYSGGVTGKGLGKGIRKLGFMPEDSTDFIFASISEEWGLVGAYLLVVLFMWFMWSCKQVSARAPDKVGAVLAGTMGAAIGLQVIMHIGVNFAVLPPTGIGLPLISVGGTRMVMLATGIAMVISVSSRRKIQPELAGEKLPDPEDTGIESLPAKSAEKLAVDQKNAGNISDTETSSYYDSATSAQAENKTIDQLASHNNAHDNSSDQLVNHSQLGQQLDSQAELQGQKNNLNEA